MSFIIHTKAEEKFNKDGYDLLGLITELSEPPDLGEKMEKQVGSLSEKIAIDWSDKLVDAPITISNTRDDEKIDIYENYKGISIGLNQQNYPKLESLVGNLFKIKSVSDKVTYEFLFENIFKWLVKSYKVKRAETNLIDFLKAVIETVTGDYIYSFRILNLEIGKKFQFGQVEFEFLDSNYLDKLSEGKTKENADALRQKLQGNVYATCLVKGVQRQKGLKIAFDKCCKAMNVLKLFCVTVNNPSKRTPFDIDSRVTMSEANEYIIRDHDIETDFKMTLASNSVPHKFTETTIENILESAKNFVALVEIKEPNELQNILLNAIERFSELISFKDIHRRIVDLFTIWESLVLKNESVNIQDSLIFFGTHLIGVRKEMKDEFKSFIMSLYDIRSQMVHHGKRKELDLEKLRLLQINTVRLIESCFVNSSRHVTKYLLIEAIEKNIGMTIEEYTEKRKLDT